MPPDVSALCPQRGVGNPAFTAACCDGTVKVRVATLDGSDLNAEISVPCSVFIDDDPTSVKIEEASTETTLKEKRYFTIDGKQVTAPVSGQPYVEWSIYSNGQIVSRKVMKR